MESKPPFPLKEDPWRPYMILWTVFLSSWNLRIPALSAPSRLGIHSLSRSGTGNTPRPIRNIALPPNHRLR